MTRLPAFFSRGSSMFSIWIALAVLGSAVLALSISVVPSSKAAMLGIVLGGVILQASIVLFALSFGREKPRPRKRRLGVEAEASQSPPARPRLSAARGNPLPRIRAAPRPARAARFCRFGAAQLDAPDLAGDRLRQFGEFEPADPLERRQMRAADGGRSTAPCRGPARYGPAPARQTPSAPRGAAGRATGRPPPRRPPGCSISALSSSNGLIR